MPWIKMPDGTQVHLNMGRTRKPALCSWCKRFVSDELCDWRRPGQRKSCNAPLCNHCAEHVGPDTDFCPHHLIFPQQDHLFGEAA